MFRRCVSRRYFKGIVIDIKEALFIITSDWKLLLGDSIQPNKLSEECFMKTEETKREVLLQQWFTIDWMNLIFCTEPDGDNYHIVEIPKCSCQGEFVQMTMICPRSRVSYHLSLQTKKKQIQEWDRDWYRDQMESIVSHRNVHTDLRQRQGPGLIVSYCSRLTPCTSARPFPLQCE